MAQKQERLAIKVVLPPCRMSFPWLFKPQDTDGGPRYQLNMLFPPKTDFKKFKDALYDCMEDMFGKDPKKWPSGRNDRGPDQVIRDATEKDYEGYKDGWHFVKAASKDPVGIVDARRDPVISQAEVYGGRWCRCSVTVVAYDNKSKGVGVYLNSVQLLDHDEQFGGRGEAKNDFEDWDGDPLSKDERGTGTGTSVSRSRGGADEDDRDSRRGRDDTRRSSRDDEDDRDSRSSRGRRGGSEESGDPTDDEPRGRDRGARDTRDRDRDDRGSREDDRGTRRPREPEEDRRPRGRDDDVRGSRDRDDRDRDDGRGRGRDRDTRDDDRPSRGRGSSRDEEWN
jgi:hypothetical protein